MCSTRRLYSAIERLQLHMSPEAVELAKRRIRLRLVDEARNFINAWNEMASEFAERNTVQSSRFALVARGLCEKELLRLGEIVLGIIRDVIDKEGFTPTEDNRGQTQALLTEALREGSEDVEKVFASRTRGLLPGDPNLAAGRAHAIESALADFDVDLLGRARRRPPLDDALSAPRYHPVREHWRKGLALAANSPPDLENAIKEAVSAVESLAQVVLGKPGTTLGEAVKQLRARQMISAGADGVLEGLWTFANSSPGVRHGSALPANATEADWLFAKTTSEAALRLLLDSDAA